MLSEQDLQAAEAAAASRDYGTVLRIHRQAHGWTLEQAGGLAGYSVSQMSRMETGTRRLADVHALRRLAAALDVPLRLFGLDGPRTDRRQVLGQFAGLAGLALVPVPALAEQGISAGLDDLLFGLPRSVEPVTLPELGDRIAAAYRDLDACRYRELAQTLPDLVRAAAATREAQPLEQRGPVSALLSDCYVLGCDLLTKLHENGSAWAMADRAVQAADAAGDPRALAQARRRAAIVLRRSAHAAAAQKLTVDTARDYAASTALAGAGDAGTYANLLCTASYTAALGGDSTAAYDLVGEARAAVAEHGGAGFGGNDIHLYVIGIARALGDYGVAVQHTRLVRLDRLGTPERQARYWEDTALAWAGHGRADLAYRAMLRAEQAAPQEVRYRPWAQQLTTRLLAGNSAQTGLSGLREFAGRIGVR